MTTVATRDGEPPGAVAASDGTPEATADAAYEAKQWAACAEQWMTIARTVEQSNPHRALYKAAGCYALDGKLDLAFATLGASIAAGRHAFRRLETDPDFVGLHGDPRWARMVAAMKEQRAAWEETLKAPELRRELLAMFEEDQAARWAYLASQKGQDEAAATQLGRKVEAIDRKHTAALKAVIARYGWPGKSLVGEDGANAAWTLAQHADLDRALQRDVLARMQSMVECGEVDATDYAYLYDRIAVAEHRPQRYGTQLSGAEPAPIEDEANVDARRKAIGLSSMAEYKQVMARINGPSK
jgi:hypothetical protein